MGFYGNITNTARTQFQFDRIFSSRQAMVEGQGTDGVYMGRYVLVEYDSDVQLDNLLRVQIGTDGSLYYNPTGGVDFTTHLTQALAEEKQIVYTYSEDAIPAYTFYIITSKKVADSIDPAQYRKVVESDSNYVVNYNLDVSIFGEGRGYDSTVWQKAYIDGVAKYIMIAELNTVVPTFDISADAPTATPLVPHFDTKSTDVYYKLHQQPTWGFRIAESASGQKQNLTNDANYYPSDEQVSYEKTTYDIKTGETTTKTVSYNGAIYFNRDGFNSAVHNKTEETITDEIAVVPTGLSGNYYNKHDGTSGQELAPDIQELRIILPSLGNTLCEIWDKIYGYNEHTNQRYKDIAWKDAKNDSPDLLLGGMTRDPETLAGCINITHDLLGMIITNATTDPPLTEEEYLRGLIYKKEEKYYRIQQSPKYKIVPTTLPDRGDYDTLKEYNTAYVEAIETAIASSGYANNDWYSVKDNDVRRYATNAISGIGNGWELAYPEGYNYNLVEIEDFAGSLGTVNGLILQLKNLLENDDSETRDKNTVQGAINSLNDMIGAFINLTESSGFDTVKVLDKNLSSKDASGVLKLKGDSWIDVDVNNVDSTITFQHNIASDSNLTSTYSYADGTYSPDFGDRFKIPVISYDEKGHIKTTTENNIILPTFSFMELSSSEDVKSKVITGYIQSDVGSLDFSSNDIGKLTLTGYDEVSGSFSNNSISASDTILEGFKKVETQVSQLASNTNDYMTQTNETLNNHSEQLQIGINILSKQTRFVENIILTASGWLELSQTVALSHTLLETDTPHIGLLKVSQETQEEYAKIGQAETVNDNGVVKIKFSCLEEVPKLDLTLQIEVIRV